MRTLTVLMPLPSHDFDPTEVALTWQILHQAGFKVSFATEDGQRAFADPLMISGRGLDIWGWIPGLKRFPLLGLALRASKEAREAYEALQIDTHFLKPLRYETLKVNDFDALVLPGGHAKGMRPYLESPILQAFVADFFEHTTEGGHHKPIAAVCHGVLLAARSRSRHTGKSVLHGRKTTALTWSLERSAWNLTRFGARFWDPDYYRTYTEGPGEPVGFWSVESEIKRLLANEKDFFDVAKGSADFYRKTSGLFRDSTDDDRPAHVVQDGNYLSARWPGDVHTLARRFIQMMAAYYSD